MSRPFEEGFAAGMAAVAAISQNAYSEGFDAGFAAARAEDVQRLAITPSKAATAGRRRTASRRKRAVMLVPAEPIGEMQRALTLGGQYAVDRRIDIAAAATGLPGALAMLASGDAEVVIALTVDQLWPLIQVVTYPVPTRNPQADPRTRRVQRVRDDQNVEPVRPMPTDSLGAQVIPIRTEPPDDLRHRRPQRRTGRI